MNKYPILKKTDRKTSLEVSMFFTWGKARKIANGCGTEGWKGKIVPETIYGINVTKACNIHDYDYFYGVSKEDKVIADQRFKRNLQYLIRKGTVISDKWYKKHFDLMLLQLKLVRCNTYYFAVKRLGHDAFWEGK